MGGLRCVTAAPLAVLADVEQQGLTGIGQMRSLGGADVDDRGGLGHGVFLTLEGMGGGGPADTW